MKKLSIIFILAILLAGGAIGAMSNSSYAQGYPPPPAYTVVAPWVGGNTPWVFYKGDWFLNGMLYYFFGNRYGWAPYYAYAPTYIVRPNNWYEPRWNTWYQQHPQYWQTFTQRYPYWRDHRYGQRYDQNFYNRYHRAQGGGWQKGFHGRAIERPQPEGRRPGPAGLAPREGQRPGPAQVAPPPGQRPGPAQVAPHEGRRTGPAQVAPHEGQRPGPAVTHPEGRKPGPAPAGGEKAPAGKHEKTGPGEEKH
jgi:hypothetical protein